MRTELSLIARLSFAILILAIVLGAFPGPVAAVPGRRQQPPPTSHDLVKILSQFSTDSYAPGLQSTPQSSMIGSLDVARASMVPVLRRLVERQTSSLVVPVIAQRPELPTGCEATTLAMLLNWAGINLSKTAVADLIPTSTLPFFMPNGSFVGPNPEVAFVGDPRETTGYGVYERPVLMVARALFPGRTLNLTGESFDTVLSYVKHGHPVMVWTTIGLLPPNVMAVWQDPSGNRVNWIAGEHSMLVVGVTEDSVIANDPWSGRQETYPRELFARRWRQMGSRGLTILSPDLYEASRLYARIIPPEDETIRVTDATTEMGGAKSD